MKNFVRGAGIHIAVTFKNADGNPVTPTGANITLSYVPRSPGTCERTFLTYPMAANTTPGTFDWLYDWDSSVSEPGVIYATAATADTPASKVDFEFRLTANRANKELAGDDGAPVMGY